jgi:hypothetical protein
MFRSHSKYFFAALLVLTSSLAQPAPTAAPQHHDQAPGFLALVGGCDLVTEMYRSGDLSVAVRQTGAVLTE